MKRRRAWLNEKVLFLWQNRLLTRCTSTRQEKRAWPPFQSVSWENGSQMKTVQHNAVRNTFLCSISSRCHATGGSVALHLKVQLRDYIWISEADFLPFSSFFVLFFLICLHLPWVPTLKTKFIISSVQTKMLLKKLVILQVYLSNLFHHFLHEDH